MASSRSTSAAENSRGSRVRPFRAPASFSRAKIGTARIDSYSSSGRFGNALKRSSRCACAAIITGSRDAAAVPGTPGHLLDPRAERRPQDQLVGLLVVEVDEAGVGAERVRHLAGDEGEHFL